MNPESLIASAAINIGLAVVILSLFSILKKQPSYAPVYYPLRLSQSQSQSQSQRHRHRHVPNSDQPLTLRRFLPSLSWIRRAYGVSEDEILDSSGLDALIIIRLFKFGSVTDSFLFSDFELSYSNGFLLYMGTMRYM